MVDTMNSRLAEKSSYYLHKGGYESGPFSLGKLQEMLSERDAKLADLRATLASSIARSGKHTPDEVRAWLAAQRAARRTAAE